MNKQEIISYYTKEILKEYPFLTHDEAEGFIEELYIYLDGFFFKDGYIDTL